MFQVILKELSDTKTDVMWKRIPKLYSRHCKRMRQWWSSCRFWNNNNNWRPYPVISFKYCKCKCKFNCYPFTAKALNWSKSARRYLKIQGETRANFNSEILNESYYEKLYLRHIYESTRDWSCAGKLVKINHTWRRRRELLETVLGHFIYFF